MWFLVKGHQGLDLGQCASHRRNTMQPLQLRLNKFLVNNVSLTLIHQEKNPWLFCKGHVWKFFSHTLFIQVNCLFEIRSHIIAKVLHRIASVLKCLLIDIWQLAHFQFLSLVDDWLVFIFLVDILLNLLYLLTQYSKGWSDAVVFYELGRARWTIVKHVVWSQDVELNCLCFPLNQRITWLRKLIVWLT